MTDTRPPDRGALCAGAGEASVWADQQLGASRQRQSSCLRYPPLPIRRQGSTYTEGIEPTGLAVARAGAREASVRDKVGQPRSASLATFLVPMLPTPRHPRTKFHVDRGEDA